MTNNDIEFAEYIYGHAEMWYVFYDNKIQGPFDLFEAEKIKDSYLSVLDNIDVTILVCWNSLKNETIKVFGE